MAALLYDSESPSAAQLAPAAVAFSCDVEVLGRNGSKYTAAYASRTIGIEIPTPQRSSVSGAR
jgi:hypothetical protein